jgi:peptidoglycan/LPS O-acetylase OafA/YrhL
MGERRITGGNVAAARVAAARPRLTFIDGIRGLSALYVALYHAAGDVPPPALALRFLAGFLQFGHYAVGVFIVVSGYCLMLPVARSANGRIEGGWRGYAIRRARRLLPPYYLVLLLAVAAVAIVRPWHPATTGEEADVLRLNPGTLVSHLLLIHNLREAWAQAFDPPMWSVAAEWQIYALFPLLLLPIWRRLGSVAVVLCGFVVGLAPHTLLPARNNFDWTFPWYIGLFTLGMAGAAVNFSSRRVETRWREGIPWGKSAVVLGVLFIAMVARYSDLPVGRMWLPDTILGCAIAALLVHCAAYRPVASGANDGAVGWLVLLRFLTCAPIQRVGACSYSLYLLHAPVLWLFTLILDHFRLGPNVSLILRIAAGVPLAVGVSYVFYLVVERRFARA